MKGKAAPRLSVVTPSLNSGGFLGEALDSMAAPPVAHQGIVVDGGSSDGTLELSA
jgi:glycosyltransferase involved in cell wall biosynthesis